MPVLMVLLLLCVQAAIWAQADWAAQTAAQDGERAASVGGQPAAGRQAVAEVLGASPAVVSFPPPAVTVDAGGNVDVQVQATARGVLPGLDLPVRAERRGPVQQFRVFG